jgi:hypothetical protein
LRRFCLRLRKLFNKDNELNIDVKPIERAAAKKLSARTHAALAQAKMDVQPK